jgi:hypothetical protein
MNPHDDDTMFDYAQKIKSPFLFNVVLIRTIEKFVKQGNIDKATAYAKLYRMDGLAELRQQRYLFRIRHYAGFNFENVLIQCVYLEKINSGTNTDEGFQILFNPKSAVPRLSLDNLPRPLTVDNMIKKCDIRLVGENGKYGYINSNTGERLTPVKYDDVCGWTQNFAHLGTDRDLAKVQLNGKWGCINKDGMEIVPLKYDEIEIYRSDNPCIAACIDGKWGFIDNTGAEIIPFEYDSVCSFYSHRARVEENGKYGYIDDKGAIVIPIIYDDCEPQLCERFLCRVALNGKYGYIDMNGKEVIKFRYEYAAPFHSCDGMVAAVVFNGKMGFIDEAGKEIIPCIYEPLDDPKDYDSGSWFWFYDGFNVRLNGKWGVIDKNNKVLVPFLYDAFLDDRNIGWRYAKRDGKKLTIDTKGHERLVKKNPHARTFKDCLRTVTLEEVVENGRLRLGLSDEKVEGLKTGFYKFSARQPRPSKNFIRINAGHDSSIGVHMCSVKEKHSCLFFALEEVLDMEVRLEDDLTLSDAEIVARCIQAASDDLLWDKKIWEMYGSDETDKTENENRTE